MGCTLLTGWAIPAEFIDTPESVSIFDSTINVQRMVQQNRIRENWKDLLIEEFTKTEISDEIIGFSLGAIFATALAQEIPFQKITLLSPTFSFTAGKINPHGIPKKIVQNMIKALGTNPSLTLKKFYKNCGISQAVSSEYREEELLAGLQFLLEIELEKKEFKGSPTIEIIQAKDDRIISKHSSYDFASYYSVKSKEITGHHITPLMKLFY